MGKGRNEKGRKTVSLDREVLAELDEHSDNDSALVNDLLREYFKSGGFKSGGEGPIGLEMRLRDLERRIDEAQNERDRVTRRLERLRDEKDRIEQELRTRRENRSERLREAAEYVAGRDADNPAVENWAQKLNMTPTELKARVDELTTEP